jgi:arylsulfatase A-like enzyme
MKILTNSLFIVFLLFIFSCSSENTDSIEEESVEIKSPNILLVIADDLGKDAMPNYSEGVIKPNMPIVQNLINTGITFDNLWSYSVCSPTRASIITGKYGNKSGVLEVGDAISTSETSLQKYINTNALQTYATAIIGKWHLSSNASDPITLGVDYFAGILKGAIPDYYNWSLTENGIASTTTEYATTKLTDLAINWAQNQTKPWFLSLAYNAPHTPFHLAPTNLHSQGSLSTSAADINANPIPYFMSAIEAMDTELGRFLSSLTTEERENTLIIFIGDNGTPSKVAQSPYSKSRVKGTLYQGGINVPMVISGKGVERFAQRESALIHTTDLFSTIATIAQASASEINNSKSFYSLFSNENAAGRAYVYSEDGASYTIRNDTYKLLKFDNGKEEFYQILNDAYEETNLMENILSSEASANKISLEEEANSIRN